MKHKEVWLNLIVVCGMLLSIGAAGPNTASAQTTYMLTMTVDPPGSGTTSPPAGTPHTYNDGDIVEVSASANPGWRVLSWTGPDAIECALGSVTMTGDKACTARFMETAYFLTATASPPQGGTVEITPPPPPVPPDWPQGLPGAYPPGTLVSVTAIPSAGWQFDSWGGPDAIACQAGQLQMNADRICRANFSVQSPPPPTNESWMGDIAASIQDRRLKDVVIPGSHDAGTYAISKDSEWVSFAHEPEMWQWIRDLDYAILQAPRVIGANWARTQSPEQNIYMQLRGGIRYFDLRFVYVTADDKTYIYHGSMRGTNTRDDILNDVRRFLDEPGHEKEIIILDLTKWAKMTPYTHKQFVSKILELFKYDMVEEEYWDNPLSDIWATGRRLVVKYQDLNSDWFRGPPEPFDPPEYHLFWTDDETILFTFNVSPDCFPDLDAAVPVVPSCFQQHFAPYGVSVPSEYEVEVKAAGSSWKVIFKTPCKQSFDVRSPAPGELVISQQDKVLCRPWAETYDRGDLEYRFHRFMEYGCCNASCSSDPVNCQCRSDCSGCTSDKLFALPGLLTPDEDGKMVMCGVAREILDALRDMAWYCKIPIVGPKLCKPYEAIPNKICGTDITTAPRSLWELVSKDGDQPNLISTRVAEWMRDSWRDCQSNARENLNIAHVDFYDYSTIVDESIKINRGDYNIATQMGTFWVPPDHPPTVEGSPVEIWAHFNDDDPCDHHTATISWGDGTMEDLDVIQATNQITASHTFADNGTYDATLCVRDGVEPDDSGYSYHYTEDCSGLSIVVDNVAPTVDAGADQIIYEGDVITLDPATFLDPGFDCPSCLPRTEENFSATIDWGDGTTTETVPPGRLHETPGSYDPSTEIATPTTGTVEGSHQYLGPPGVYTTTVCVKDDDMPDYTPEACDSLNVMVVHGFLRFCAYADDEHPGVTAHQDAVAACALVPSGIPGEMRPSGLGSRGEVDVKDRAAIQDILLSLTNKIDVGKDASIYGPLTAGRDVKVDQRSQIYNSITSGHRVEVKRDAWVDGDINAADRVKADPTQVTGAINEFTSVPPIPDVTWVQFWFEPGSEKVTVEKDTTLTLIPGAYKDVKVKKGGTLILSGQDPFGQYVFKKFEMEKDTILQLDLQNGPIVVDVADKLEFKENVQMHIYLQAGDPDPRQVLFRVAGNRVELKKEGTYLGTFLAPNADVKLGDDAILCGALYGKKVDIGKRVYLEGFPARDLFALLFVNP